MRGLRDPRSPIRPPCEESNLDLRLRKPNPEFRQDRECEKADRSRHERCCSAPPEIRTRKKSFRRRRLVHRACGAESREGVAPSRAVLQTAILTREPAHDSLQKHSNKSALGGNRTRTANVKCPFGKLASLPRPFETRPGASATLGLTPPRAALSRTSPASSHMEQVHSHLFARFRFRSFFRCPFRWDDQGGGVGENRIRISRVQTGRSPI
jgi:hypothetical protein